MPCMTASPTDARASWQRAVAGVLAKTRGGDPADLGPDPERRLDTTTYDGLTIHPLYSPADDLPEQPLPGHAPYVRGARPAGGRGWGVCARYGDDGDAATANKHLLDDLANGVTSVWLAVDPEGDNGVAPREVRAALEGVLLDLAPVRLDPAAAFTEAADALLAVAEQADLDDRSQVRLSLGADPWTLRIRHGAPVDGATLDDAAALAVQAAARPERIRTLTVDGTVFHDAGASDADEVGACLAAGVGYVRTLMEAGLDAAQAFRAIEFRHAISDDQFAGIAKLRAARTAWARVAQVAGVSDDGAAAQHAVTSRAMMARRDPWVNLLRTTLAAFAAGVGGAQDVTVLPFDDAIAGSAPGVSERFAARIARNTQLLLLEESHAGRVADPAGGSWYVERYTQALADRAWQFFQDIERAGGFADALGSGLVAERIAETRATRTDDIARRRTGLTGVSEFPKLDEPATAAAGDPHEGDDSLAATRYAQQFDDLRDRSDRHHAATGRRPTVLLATLGPVAEHNQRATYGRNLLASGGVDVVESGPLEDPSAAQNAMQESGLSVAVLCGIDGRYESVGAETVDALRSAGALRVYAVGGRDTFGDVEPDTHLAPGIDVVAKMSELLDLLEVPA